MPDDLAQLPFEWLALAAAPGLHAGLLAPAIEAVGAAEQLVGCSEARLRELGLNPAAARALAAPDRDALEAQRAWARREGLQLVRWGSAAYPELLAQVQDAPVALWVRGHPAVLARPQVAVVGSRNPTPAGRRDAADLAAGLARVGLAITSGLALGIDAAAHEGALGAGGASVAVCGTGLDRCYPSRHAQLAARLAANGAVISEFPPGTEPRPENFPRRNRIISGLARGVLVVEAARNSGSLITAGLAGDHGRSIFAVPGSIHSPLSRGCHQLLRQGARLVETVADVLEELGWTPQISFPEQALAPPDEVPESRRSLDKAGEMLLDALGFEPASIEDLIVRTGQPAPDIASMLVLLELEGLVETLPGGLYSRLDTPSTGK